MRTPLAVAALTLVAVTGHAQEKDKVSFVFPCEGYLSGLKGKGNFGVYIKHGSSPFRGSYHLAEDVWLPGGTTVRSIGDGIVRYSDFSPTWKDKRGRIHWNLGNVIVIEHALDPPEKELKAICSVYVHLGAGRKVAVGDKVKRGQVLGTIGKDKSEENGRYPAHLHFGIHKGPYYQIAPSWRRELEQEARTTGIVAGPNLVLRGEISMRQVSKTSVLIKARKGGNEMVLSLLVGSTYPGRKPVDIIGWCTGYGNKEAVAEWLRPGEWLAKHGAR